MKRFFMVLWMTVMIPYVTTLAWTGRIRTDTGAEVPAEEPEVLALLLGPQAARDRHMERASMVANIFFIIQLPPFRRRGHPNRTPWYFRILAR